MSGSVKSWAGRLVLVVAVACTGCGDGGDAVSDAGNVVVKGGATAADAKPQVADDVKADIQVTPDPGEPAGTDAKKKDEKPTRGPVGPLPPDPIATPPMPMPSPADLGEIILTRSRYYRLEVDTLDKTVLVTVARRWLYKDGFPKGLIAGIRRNAKVKQTDRSLFDARDGKITASEYIRWDPPADVGSYQGALLLYIEGTDTTGAPRHELAISVDLALDASLGQATPKRTLKFDEMEVALDLVNGKLTTVSWASVPLADSDGEDDGSESTVEIEVTGSLTEASSKNILGADSLLADDVSTALRAIARVPFLNESHHGITLGWLGLDTLKHGLIVVPRPDGKRHDFQYSVGGSSFPLDVFRRQLEPTSWPIVLRGRIYAGTARSGRYVYQPIECLLSRRPADPSKPPTPVDDAKKAKKKPVKKAVKKPVKKPTKKAVKAPVKKTVKKTVKKPVDKAVKKDGK